MLIGRNEDGSRNMWLIFGLQGYEADNPNINLLRLRNYTIGKKLKDGEVLGPGGLDRIAILIGVLEPFVSFLPFRTSCLGKCRVSEALLTFWWRTGVVSQ